MSKKILVIIVILAIIAILFFWFMLFVNKGNQKTNSNSETNFEVQGVKVEITRAGRGDEQVKSNDYMVVNYINTLSDGTKIDSTYDQNRRPLTFKVGNGEVLKGWDAGLIGMKVGEIRKLTIPPNMAFGDAGFPAAGIPKNATLISQVELLAIQH